MSESIFYKINQQKRFIEEKGYNVLYIGLYGSQNYNLHDENSDIDLRAIVLPTLSQIIKREKISIKYSNEIGDIDVKDIMTYYEVVRKGNFSFIEPMQTKWFIGDKYLRELFGLIPLNLMSLKGDMFSKAKVFRHPFPSKEKEISQWGYDPKQLHHIFRMVDILILNSVYKSFLEYNETLVERREWLISVKKNKNEFIQKLHKIGYIDISSVDTIKEWIEENTKQYIKKDYKYEQVDLLNEVVKYIENKLKPNIFKSNIQSAREYRTFGKGIPKDDLKKFDELKKYKNEDISYIVYETLEIL
jgi:predicted nucleotidyltransferase